MPQNLLLNIIPFNTPVKEKEFAFYKQRLPVTIKYPEMMAEIYPHFQHDKLPDFGKENLWFL